jgi:GNAT superfamily N-acetyltransferase
LLPKTARREFDVRRPFSLRGPRSGDIRWAIERHGILYSQEFGFNEQAEGLVAKLLGGFLERRDYGREGCWIAELGGERVGCAFLFSKSDEPSAAQLHCLLVEPSARGGGIGRALLDECVRFAVNKGYSRVTLRTYEILAAARVLYASAGFTLLTSEPLSIYGCDLVSEIWEMPL